jgi:aspartyl/asparaginyl-tRNA synthetase
MLNTITYHTLVQEMRKFFLERNYIEVPAQSRLSILAACENPHSVATFDWSGSNWPLPQTGQMWLEFELLKNPDWAGCFCLTTSYRAEKDPIPGRHETIFPMFEFESKGGMKDLIDLEAQLLDHLGFGVPVEKNYEDLCLEYGGVEILEDEHESRMWREIGSCISLQNFPSRTSPFWNMERSSSGTYNKIDIILYGQETIGSAERSCNREAMRESFETISEGAYAEKLHSLFGKDRVQRELDEFLALDFFPRFGGGIGMTRMARAWDLLQESKSK